MDAQEINRTFDLFPIVEAATTIKKTGKFYVGSCPFCGGSDRFNLTHKPDGWRWLCRKCAPRYQTPIDYIMRRDGLVFKLALEAMGGDLQRRPAPAQRPTPPPPEVNLPDSKWQGEAWQRISRDALALEAHPSGEVAKFLDRRGMHRGTRDLFWLGESTALDPVTKRSRPALLIPWCDSETVTCFSFRFVDTPQPDEERYKSYGQKEHSARLLFGLQNLSGLFDTLAVFEGEINAMSVNQAAASVGGMGLDCVSIGAQTPSAAALWMLRSLAERYKRLVLWMDDHKIAAKVQETIGGPAKLLHSPEVSGVKYDANQMLQDGLLVGFLRQTVIA